jgi:succinate-acetate transporter protein
LAWALLAPISINVTNRLISKLFFSGLSEPGMGLFFSGFAALIFGTIEISSFAGISAMADSSFGLAWLSLTWLGLVELAAVDPDFAAALQELCLVE